MKTSRFITLTFVVCLLLSLVLVVHLLFGFLTPVVVALIIVSLFSPMHQRLLKLVRNHEYLAATLSTLLMLIGVLVPLTAFFFILAQQSLMLFKAIEKVSAQRGLAEWISSLKENVEFLNTYLSTFHIELSPDRIVKLVENFAQSIGVWFYSGIGLFASNMLSFAFNFLLTIALVFVFFVSGRATKNFIVDLIPLPEDEKERVINRFRELSFAVFIGNGLISALEGILGGLSFFVFGIEGALIFGVLITITAFLPLVGASIVTIPTAIYLLLNHETWQAVAFLLFNSLHMTILETFVKPRFIGTKSQMHAVLVFMSILAGIQVYGVLGLFYGPLLITVFLTLVEIYKEHYRPNLLQD